MSLILVSASTQRLYNDNQPKITAYPFSCGLWVRPTSTTGTQTILCFADTATTNNWWALNRNAGTNFQFSAAAGGTTNSASTGVPVSGRWFYIVIRGISATNRKIAVLNSFLGPTHATTATSRSPAGVDTNVIGAFNTTTVSQYFDGEIQEFWYTLTDIQPDGAQLQGGILKTLAYRGPLAVPRIAKDIVEYRRFTDGPSYYFQQGTDRGTTNNNYRNLYTGGGRPRIQWNGGGYFGVGSCPMVNGVHGELPRAQISRYLPV